MCVSRTRGFWCVPVILLFVLCVSRPSVAWRAPDHEILTQRAVRLYERCHKLRFTVTEIAAMVAGNVGEDYNLAVKWLKNSHYYNPDKWVRTLYRDDAGYRVQYLTEKLLAGRQPQLRILGKIMHFVQDVASPTHVVPIVHDLRDGFEKFKLPAAAILPHTLPCPPADAADPHTVLTREARRTLASMRGTAQATRDGRPYEFSWTMFWSTGLGSRFGYYGFFGNRFGETRPIKIMGHIYLFPPAIFHAYKLVRSQQAIAATAEVLHWYRTQDVP